MSRLNNNTQAFFELVRAGLWEKEARLEPFGEIYYTEIQRLAEEQAVVGLVVAGLERVADVKVPKLDLLQFIGQTLQIEQRNLAMNDFIADLIIRMRKEGIYTLLVKGQGVAQCYERPAWRTSGDVDLLLSEDNYNKAKAFLLPLASNVEEEDAKRYHLGMTIEQWLVELHGTLHSSISPRINQVVDEAQSDIFYRGEVRSWMDHDTQVFLPSPNCDVIFIFTHFINHFYGEGIGLRQISDWCRVLWVFRDRIDAGLLEQRLKKAGLETEWKVFGCFAVEYLGMPEDAMPLLADKRRYSRKASSLSKLIIETGNLGQNKDNSYRGKYSRFKENVITFFRRFKEFMRIGPIFPRNAVRFFISYSMNRIKAMISLLSTKNS